MLIRRITNDKMDIHKGEKTLTQRLTISITQKIMLCVKPDLVNSWLETFPFVIVCAIDPNLRQSTVLFVDDPLWDSTIIVGFGNSKRNLLAEFVGGFIKII